MNRVMIKVADAASILLVGLITVIAVIASAIMIRGIIAILAG